MNTLGLNLILKMGCICSREGVEVNNTKYYVIERLGEGGFSTVDLVENAHTKRRYALKRITCHSIEDQKIALAEVEYMKQIKHQNVIELIDSTFKGTADIVVNAISELYMVLPYYKNGTLHDYLDIRAIRKQYLDVHDILRIFNDVCEAVKCFHDMTPEPLAHRDLKTANICLTDGLSPILMDLGSTAPARVQVCGSPEAQRLQELAAERCSMPYRLGLVQDFPEHVKENKPEHTNIPLSLAPELFNVESYCVIDQRTDIWSLGCVLYAMCYFKSPFDAVYERGDSVALAVISGNIHFPEETPFDEDMHGLIMYMLKMNPMERPYIYSVIERTQDCISKLENKV